MSGAIYTNPMDLIGNTPLFKVDGVYVKAEYLNPTGSSKDRIAYEMLKHERRDTILEASSGNTAISLAFVCQLLGKRFLVFVPRNTSYRKQMLIKVYGAIINTNCRDLTEACNMATNLLDGSTTMRYVNQFANKNNVIAQTKMAQEIKDAGIEPDYIVMGIGTAGTLAGLYNVFPNAVFHTPVATDFRIEGISDGVALPLKPKKCNLVEVPVGVVQVRITNKYLLTKGYYVGDSSAANFYVADKIKKQYSDKTVLTIFHDAGWRY